jgi:3-(methylthio)propionyl---CoA ligase
VNTDTITMQPMQIVPLRVCDILTFAADNHGDVVMASRMGSRVVHHTYATLHERSRRTAAGLARLGLQRGGRMATIAWNHHRHFELYYAIPGIGAVIHTINPRVAPEQIAYMIEAAADTVLAYDSEFAPLVAEVMGIVSRPLVLVDLGDGAPSLPGAISYEALATTAPIGDWAAGAETEPFGICFTSGTTGNPKGVMYTHRSTVLHAMACCMSEGQAISSRETIMPVVPMFHANAWGLAHSAPMAGARLVLPGRFLDGQSVLDLIEAEQVTFVCGVPTVWQSTLDFADANKRTLGSLKRAGMGGSAPSAALIERLESRGVDVFHAWGMTETNPSAGTGFLKTKHAAEPMPSRTARKMRQGRGLFGLQKRLVDDDGRPVPHDGLTSGRLLVRGNWVVGQYFNVDTPTLQDGWFDTGDVATIDADGYLCIVDRAKDLIKSGGEWISSIALENTALTLDGVQQAAALARPDPKWGERPVMVVVRRPGSEVTEQQVIDVIASHLPRWQTPDAVFFRDTLPLTAVGKIDKKKLRAELAV